MKKTWQAPQLIVLVRSKPEEAVLGNCKTVFNLPGPTLGAFQCAFMDNFVCASCNIETAS